jgi:hypothetical protein
MVIFSCRIYARSVRELWVGSKSDLESNLVARRLDGLCWLRHGEKRVCVDAVCMDRPHDPVGSARLPRRSLC